MEESFKLEYRPGAGDILRYSIAVSTEQSVRGHDRENEQRFTVDMIMAQKILEVHGDGRFESEYCLESGEMKQEDQTFPLPGRGVPFTVMMKKNGEILSTSMDLPFLPPSFPERELCPGDRWTHRSPVTLPFDIVLTGENGLFLEYEYEIEGTEDIFGTHCVCIAVKCPERTVTAEPDFEQTMSGSGKVYFACEEGKLLSFHNYTLNEISSKDIRTEITVHSTMDLL